MTALKNSLARPAHQLPGKVEIEWILQHHLCEAACGREWTGDFADRRAPPFIDNRVEPGGAGHGHSVRDKPRGNVKLLRVERHREKLVALRRHTGELVRPMCVGMRGPRRGRADDRGVMHVRFQVGGRIFFMHFHP